jgi:hypothetical protein
MVTFKPIIKRTRMAQNFDKNKITLTKAGKTYNVYDKIQENREDTEIYPTLEKYGCIDRMMLNTQGVYADFQEFKGLREMKDQQIKADQMFYNLPLEVRTKFQNDKNLFMRDGEKWIKEMITKEAEANKGFAGQPTWENKETETVKE